MEWIVEIFRRHFRPLEPIPPDSEVFHHFAPSRMQKPPWANQIRAVLFDLYGTLWISSSGPLEPSRNPFHREAIRQALDAVGLRPSRWTEQEAEVLFRVINSMHEGRRAQGVAYPEISIAEAWSGALHQLARWGVFSEAEIQQVDGDRLAVEYEARANPLWPMPGAEQTLGRLRAHGYVLGVVSNAQFYTPSAFSALFGRVEADLGFYPCLVFYSYEHGEAKPGEKLFRLAQQELAHRQIAPPQTLHVGNDMFHDIWAAHRVGFRTVLFAGDQRSLRLRTDEPLLRRFQPDAVITRLDQLADWFCTSS